MLRKATQQWLGSPLGYNMLLSALMDSRSNVEKYIQISNVIKDKHICSIETKLFVSSYKLKNGVINSMNVTEVQEIDFSKCDNDLNAWVNSFGEKKNYDFTRQFNSKANYVLANVCSLQSAWTSCSDSGPVMKIYNSFTYTQDVKYEARLLELSLQSGLQLIIVVPNEADVLQNLYSILRDQRLAAAVNSIQPLFTAKCELNAPNISISSRINLAEKINGFAKSNIEQYGVLNVNKTGANVTVFTCFCAPSNMTAVEDEHTCTKQPFYIAIVYEDLPLFVGQFTQ